MNIYDENSEFNIFILNHHQSSSSISIRIYFIYNYKSVFTKSIFNKQLHFITKVNLYAKILENFIGIVEKKLLELFGNQ